MGRGVSLLVANLQLFSEIDYAKESAQEFDELLIEKNRYGAIWLHFAVRPKENRHRVNFINA